MKLTLVVGILGLVIGFLVGRSQEPGAEDVEKQAVVESERVSRERMSRGSGDRSRESRKREGKKMMEEAAQMGNDLSEISQARLMKWILELEAGDFPGVLEELRKLGGASIDDPFATDSGTADFLTVAMGRWYELEGESVLNWVLTKPEVLEGWSTRNLLVEMIGDSYHEDPELSFQMMKKYVGTSEGIGNWWLYQVGKWSRNLEGEFEELMTTSTFEEPVPNDPFTFDDVQIDKLRNFLRGMIDGGREVELREWLGGEPKAMNLLDSLLGENKVKELKDEGWQALKGAIDRGDLLGGDYVEVVFENWWQEDEAAAIDWYLGQKTGAEERAEMIRKAALVMGNTGSLDDDPFAEGIRDANRSIAFLNEMKSEGKPIDLAWKELVEFAVSGSQWDVLETMKPHLPPDVWDGARTGIERAVLGVDRLSLMDAEISFREIGETGEAVLERFGMKEQVLEKVARQNEENLRKLHQILGVE